MWWDKIVIKLCLKCGKLFSTIKSESERFCSEECETQFHDNIKQYTFSKEERYLIRDIKEPQY